MQEVGGEQGGREGGGVEQDHDGNGEVRKGLVWGDAFTFYLHLKLKPKNPLLLAGLLGRRSGGIQRAT